MMLRDWFILLFFLIIFTTQAKNIVVTGGAGFIGSHVAQALVHRGDNVYVIDNMNDFYDPILKYNNIKSIYNSLSTTSGTFAFFEFDINDIVSMEHFFAIHTIDVICHLAARAGVQPSIIDPILYVTANVTGTVAVLEMAKKYHVPHIILASSSSVYGDSTPMPFSEDYPVNYPCSPYAANKRAIELLGATYYHLYSISCTCLRFFTVYGPRGRIDMSPFKFLHAICTNTPINLCGDGSIIRDYTYIDDIVDGVIRAIDKPLGFEIINLGRGEPITLQSFIEIIEKITSKKAIIKQIPYYIGDVIVTHADISKAKNLLGYMPNTSVCDGMFKMYEWYINEFLTQQEFIKIDSIY